MHQWEGACNPLHRWEASLQFSALMRSELVVLCTNEKQVCSPMHQWDAGSQFLYQWEGSSRFSAQMRSEFAFLCTNEKRVHSPLHQWEASSNCIVFCAIDNWHSFLFFVCIERDAESMPTVNRVLTRPPGRSDLSAYATQDMWVRNRGVGTFYLEPEPKPVKRDRLRIRIQHQMYYFLYKLSTKCLFFYPCVFR